MGKARSKLILPPGSEPEPEAKPEPTPTESAVGNVPAPTPVEPTREEYQAAGLAAEQLLTSLHTVGTQAAFFAIPEIQQICTMFFQASIEAILTNVVLADRRKIFVSLDQAIREQLRVQDATSTVSLLDPKIAAQMKSHVKLDRGTCTALMSGLTNIMGTTPAPRIKLNTGDPTQGENPPQPVPNEPGSPPSGNTVLS